MDMLRNLTQQLEALYAEREYLSAELGLHDADDVIRRVRELEARERTHEPARLVDDDGGADGTTPARLDDAAIDAADAHAIERLLDGIAELAPRLDERYPSRSVVFEVRGEHPVLKAVWHGGDEPAAGAGPSEELLP